MGLAKTKRSYVARHKGSIARGVPRIYNVDKDVEIIGYAEINLQATSILGRVKTHKGFFYCQPSDVSEGDLIVDRLDDNHYLVMSSKVESLGYEQIYLDTTLFHCTDIISVTRYGDGVRDMFGRVVDSAPSIIATNVWAMVNPQNYDILQQPDRLIAHNKISFYVQAKYGIKAADRLISSSTGRKYVVETVDQESLTQLNILHVDMDDT